MDLFDLLRTAVSLAAVFGALWYLHRRLTKGPKGGRGPRARSRAIEVVARQGLGAKAGVAVVDVDGQRYLIGVTEHAVNVLDRLGAAPVAPPVPELDVVSAPPTALDLQMRAAERTEQEQAAAALPTRAVPRAVPSAPHVGPPPVVTTVTAAVVVQQTSTTGEQSVAIVPVQPGRGQDLGAPFPTRRAAREAAQASSAETPQDEFERMLQAVIAEDQTLPAAPQEPRMVLAEPARPASPLVGSVLHPETWRQTVAALRRLR